MAFANKGFVSKKGRHTSKSLGKDMHLDKLSKIDQTGQTLSTKDHKAVNDIIGNAKDILTSTGLKYGEKLVGAAIETGINTLINHADEQSALSALTSVNGLGVNNNTRTKQHVHIGPTTIKRIERQLNTPLIERVSKELSSTDKDYQEHNQRKNLTIKNGFNEKCFTFFMEDTYLRVKDLLEIFGQNPGIEKSLKEKCFNKHGVVDIYGCVCNVENEFKFKNILNFYSVQCELHLVKITDIHDDVRTLITEITNNKTSGNTIEPSESSSKGQDLKSKLRGEAKKFAKDVATDIATDIAMDLIDKSNIFLEGKKKLRDILQDKLSKEGTHRGSDFGRLPEDEQYSDPQVENRGNKFNISFDTSLATKLQDSVQFNDRAKILKTWHKSLSPGSIWEFSLTQHFGKGIHLNFLYDIKNLNDEHPAQYIFVLETFGDLKSSVSRKEDADLFCGYGPGKLNVDFKHKLNYIGKSEDTFDFNHNPTPTLYRVKKRDDDYVENSELAKVFHPNREIRFHIPFDEIQIYEDGASKKSRSKPYLLQYDANIVPENSLMDSIQFSYKNHGYDGKNLTEDDAEFNLDIPPSHEKDEYEGTEGDVLDLDDKEEETLDENE